MEDTNITIARRILETAERLIELAAQLEGEDATPEEMQAVCSAEAQVMQAIATELQ